MIYVSIDIETTGLDPETCQILQIGAVIEDTVKLKSTEELPKFQCLVENSHVSGSTFALNMNREILAKLGELERADRDDRSEIRKKYNIIPTNLVAKSFAMWLAANGVQAPEKSDMVSITVAGKNFGVFDKLFLEKLPGWTSLIRFKQRMIDPAILCMDWTTDSGPPNLQTCMHRAQVEGSVTHDALQDAIDVVKVVRGITRNYTTIYF
jgi:DNA polymerase III alpha subunit (gram-positive type)